MEPSFHNSNENDHEAVFPFIQKRLENLKTTNKEEYSSLQEELDEAISAWEKARAALLSINMSNIYELRVPPKAPSEEIEGVLCACMYLMAGHTSDHHIKIHKGKPVNVNWEGCIRMLNGWHRLKEDMRRMDRTIEVEGSILKGIQEVKGYLEKEWFNVESLKEKSEGAAKFADFVVNALRSVEIVREVAPKIEKGIRKAQMESQGL